MQNDSTYDKLIIGAAIAMGLFVTISIPLIVAAQITTAFNAYAGTAAGVLTAAFITWAFLTYTKEGQR